MPAPLAVALILGLAQDATPPTSTQPADVRCFQALGYRFAALPAERDRTQMMLAFYIGRLSARDDRWRTEVFQPASPPLSKDTYQPVAEACIRRAAEAILPGALQPER